MKDSILLACILFFSFIPCSSAQTLSVIPQAQSISLHSNQTLSVNISLGTVDSLYGFQYNLEYNHSIFSVNQTGISEGPFLRAGGISTLCITPDLSAQGLMKNIACTRTGPTGVSGTGNITRITFALNQSTAVPVTTQLRLSGTKLSNTSMQPIVHLVSNATISIYPCLGGEQRVSGTDVGECVSGTQTCSGNQWSACSSCIGPVAEACDNKDNDCDGYIDEGLAGCVQPIIVTTNYYDGSTTNFSSQNLSNALPGIVLEKAVYGKMVFTQNVLFTQSVDLDYNTNVSFNSVFINATVFPMLNKSATLYLYSLTFANPSIQRDGASCPPSVCTTVSYSGGTLIFNVTHFSTYSAAETGPVCGNSVCESSLGETCDTCSGDCGLCPCPSGQTRCSDGVCRADCGGSSGGGGGDECVSGQTRSCSASHTGACATGTETCSSGSWTGCPVPMAEMCNNIDDNCDGADDNGLVCECLSGQTRACGSNVGECSEGTRYCSGLGSWGVCTGEVLPSAEICNGLDDNCDGVTDDECQDPGQLEQCPEGLIQSKCMCGGKAYETGFCLSGQFSESGPPEFPWITVTIFGVIVILCLTIFIIYKQFYRKGKPEITWEQLLEKYKSS